MSYEPKTTTERDEPRGFVPERPTTGAGTARAQIPADPVGGGARQDAPNPTSEQAAHREAPPSGPAGEPAAEQQSVFRRLEELLIEIRAGLDASLREQQHRSFSLVWLAGAIVQVFVLGLIALSTLDWFFQAAFQDLLIKLAFAAVLQLVALTAFLLSGDSGS